MKLLWGIICMLPLNLLPSTIQTSQGNVAYVDTGGTGFPVVLIHGNSCSSAVFKKLILAFQDRYRLIAVDLPGHGRSDRPRDPDTAYTLPGYAQVLHEVVHHLDLGPFAVVGYSLGGNIALQWTQLAEDPIQGIMIVSCAPMKYSEEALLAYPPYEGGYATYPDQLTEAQARQYMEAVGFNVEDPTVYFMVEDAMKTDGASRAKMVTSVLSGKGIDETEIVAKLTIPLAVVIGRKDLALGHDYMARLRYRNLWHGRIEKIPDAAHAIPLHQPDQLHQFLVAFLKDINPF